MMDGQGNSVITGVAANTTGPGTGGNVQLQGGTVIIRQGGQIAAVATGAGDAGAISVIADTIGIDGRASPAAFTGIGAQTFGSVPGAGYRSNPARLRFRPARSTATAGPRLRESRGAFRLTLPDDLR